MWEVLLIALSLSVDALGIGISYGLKKTKVPAPAKGIIFVIAVFTTWFFILAGEAITSLIGYGAAKILGVVTLMALGALVIAQSLMPEKAKSEKPQKAAKKEETICNLIISSLGITIKIIKQPSSIDMDNNNIIEPKEAIYLGFALSLDSMGAGIAIGAIGAGSFLLSVSAGLFQVLFLSAGLFAGAKISGEKSGRLCSVLSGVILIFIGLLRLRS